ncbi:MAG: DUF1638 domain-containing protein [Deinococcales bacterium]
MLIIACGAIARELLWLKEANAWEFDLQWHPNPAYHNHPQDIPQTVETQKNHLVRLKGYTNEAIFVAFADCGTGGLLDKVLEKYHVKRLSGAHCYEFFSGSEVFEQHRRS